MIQQRVRKTVNNDSRQKKREAGMHRKRKTADTERWEVLNLLGQRVSIKKTHCPALQDTRLRAPPAASWVYPDGRGLHRLDLCVFEEQGV